MLLLYTASICFTQVVVDLAAGEPGSVAVGTDTYEHYGSLDICGCPVDSHLVFGALWMASLCVSVDTLALHLVSSAWSPPRGGSACLPVHSGSCQGARMHCCLTLARWRRCCKST